jgi:uncharacterized protein YceH (UPF0502 family)
VKGGGGAFMSLGGMPGSARGQRGGDNFEILNASSIDDAKSENDDGASKVEINLASHDASERALQRRVATLEDEVVSYKNKLEMISNTQK